MSDDFTQKTNLQDCADDWMTRKLFKLCPDDYVRKAAQLMAQHRIGSFLVVEKKALLGKDEKLLGIFTDKDVVRRVVARNLKPDLVKVKDIMSSPVRTIPSTYPMMEVARLFTGFKIKRLPVVKEKRLAGIMTITDLIYAMSRLRKFYDLGKLFENISNKKKAEDTDGKLLAKDWMSQPVAVVQKGTSVLDIAKMMDKNMYGALFVVGPNGYLIGIVTDTDVVHKVAALSLDPEESLVEDIMTSDVVSVDVGDDLGIVQNLMVDNRIKRVPVLERDRPVGIINLVDVINALLQLDNISKAGSVIESFYRGGAEQYGE